MTKSTGVVLHPILRALGRRKLSVIHLQQVFQELSKLNNGLFKAEVQRCYAYYVLQL